MITRAEAKKTLPEGWGELIDQMFNICEQNDVNVRLIKNKQGWLRVQTTSTLDGEAYAIMARLEKESENTCMRCGRWGKRRVRFDHSIIILCQDCEDMGWEWVRGKLRLPEES